MESKDARSAWIEPGWVRNEQGRKVTPPDGIAQSETLIKNMTLLGQFVQASSK